jgi:hypothetical protein
MKLLNISLAFTHLNADATSQSLLSSTLHSNPHPSRSASAAPESLKPCHMVIFHLCMLTAMISMAVQHAAPYTNDTIQATCSLLAATRGHALPRVARSGVECAHRLSVPPSIQSGKGGDWLLPEGYHGRRAETWKTGCIIMAREGKSRRTASLIVMQGTTNQGLSRSVIYFQ